MYILVLLFLFSGCAVKVDPKPVRVEPITVTHTVYIDNHLLYTFYLDKCSNDLPNATDQELEDCALAKMDDFYLAYNQAGKK